MNFKRELGIYFTRKSYFTLLLLTENYSMFSEVTEKVFFVLFFFNFLSFLIDRFYMQTVAYKDQNKYVTWNPSIPLYYFPAKFLCFLVIVFHWKCYSWDHNWRKILISSYHPFSSQISVILGWLACLSMVKGRSALFACS